MRSGLLDAGVPSRYDLLESERFKEPNFKVGHNDQVQDPDPDMLTLYRSMVGTLLHLSVWMHPDIAYTVNILEQHLNSPSVILLRAAKHVFQYLKGTREYGITFYNIDPQQLGPFLYAFSDTSDTDNHFEWRTTDG